MWWMDCSSEMRPTHPVHPRAQFQRSLAFAFLVLLATSANAEPTFYESRVAPIFEEHCVTCHGPEKKKGKLRLDTFEQLQHGGESGDVIIPGDAAASELFHRITLPRTDEDVMPSDGKPGLSSAEIKVIELWLKDGASTEKLASAFPDAPVLRPKHPPVIAMTADWSSKLTEIRALEKSLGVKLAPRSLNATEGLVLRTASSPSGCDDTTLAKLEPVAEFIVEAELARTKVTDAGLQVIARWQNLRALDLTRTAITSKGVAELLPLQKLERLNLTATAVDDEGFKSVQKLPALQRVWAFETKVVENSP